MQDVILSVLPVFSGYGFVDFDSPTAAQKAVTALKSTGIQAQMAKVRIHGRIILTFIALELDLEYMWIAVTVLPVHEGYITCHISHDLSVCLALF